MLPAGFEPTIPASERPQAYALDRAATGAGSVCVCVCVCRLTNAYVYTAHLEMFIFCPFCNSSRLLATRIDITGCTA